MSNRETTNWIKGTTGLVVTKIGLCQKIIQTWEEHILAWPQEEQDQLSNFFQHVNDGKIRLKYKKVKGMPTKRLWNIDCKCPADLCRKILDRILQLHVNPNSTKIVWNPQSKSDYKFTKLKPPSSRQYVEECFVCKKRDCPFERHRNGEPIEVQKNTKVDKYYWRIANMFMFYGKERNRIPNTGPEDTDIALIFKMMKNCKLFSLEEKDDKIGPANDDGGEDKDEGKDDENSKEETGIEIYEEQDEGTDDGDGIEEVGNEIYEELLDVRNFLLHSSDHRLSDEAVEECLKQMKAILGVGKFKDDLLCTKAISELSELEDMHLFMTSLSSEQAHLVKEAFFEQQSALEYDINIEGTLKNDYVLKGSLKASKMMCKTYTGSRGRDSSTDENDQKCAGTQTEDLSKWNRNRSSQNMVLGTAFGTSIGTIGGPVGTIVGAAVGGLVGSLIK